MSDESRRALRGRLMGLRHATRQISRPRCQRCGWVRTQANVDVISRGDGSVHLSGILRCGSVWECAVCQATIKTKRADIITRCAEAHGKERIVMLTLTIKHGQHHELKELRQGVAKAWRRMKMGKPWERFKSRVGYVGDVRGMEVTHGARNGWHPHLHVMIYTRMTAEDAGWKTERDWLSERWRSAVIRELGAECAPSDERGATVTPCNRVDYIAKLGLEISDPGAKRARGQSRTPWQIAADFGSEKLLSDGLLWRGYTQAMFRARQLTWSTGKNDLRKRYDISDKADEELVNESDGEQKRIAEIPGNAWDHVRHVVNAPREPMQPRRHAASVLLDAAELAGPLGLWRALGKLEVDTPMPPAKKKWVEPPEEPLPPMGEATESPRRKTSKWYQEQHGLDYDFMRQDLYESMHGISENEERAE